MDGDKAFGQNTDSENQANLERYRLAAMASGASDAVIIPANSVKVDERVRLKCIIPRCARAGETPNCPPYAPDLEVVRKALSRYSLAILIKCDVQLGGLAAGDNTEIIRKERLLFHKKGNEVVSQIERQAFRDGYHLAMGLAGGSCKDFLCEGEKCQALANGKCRFPLQSRPSIEAMGIDVTALINEAGWATYALRDRGMTQTANTVGLVFVV